MNKTLLIATALYQDNQAMFHPIYRTGCTLFVQGEQCYDLLEATERYIPDVLVVHDTMPGIHFDSFVRYLHKIMTDPPLVVFVGQQKHKYDALDSWYQQRSCYLQKPFSLSDLMMLMDHCPQLDRVQETAQERYQKQVTLLLQRMCAPMHHNGGRYLRDGIVMMLNCDYHQLMTKVIYVDVGKCYQTSKGAVERGIRAAIETVWNSSDPMLLQKYFGHGVDGSQIDAKRPSNTKFMATLAQALCADEEQKNKA